ncbi:hypothetical protein [Amycolatopsis tolypomycina]|uniref:hypothetical protein n=1 Tax=Amycolatopsis tolypomycina TaxID=208445 RepID=UPI00142D4CC9|nr:hypothetical protein [Amycolatopsis tolypomycina]
MSNHTDNRRSAIADAAVTGAGAAEAGVLGFGVDADGSVVAGSVLDGREVAAGSGLDRTGVDVVVGLA